jgi:hypothetical protein
MLLTDEEIARLQTVVPLLLSEASTALQLAPHYEFTMELETHLQPGLRIRAPETPETAGDPDAPPYPLDLFVGLPLDELRGFARADDASRAERVAHFGAAFAPRLLRAINAQTPHEIDLEAGVQSQAGTLAVMLDDEQAK